jgi:TfoX/Sxy family transcriptional regulator of competence genes
MDYDTKNLQQVFTAAVPDQELTYRPMFGGILVYAGGRPLASLSNMGLGLKMCGPDHAVLLGMKGAERLRYDMNAPLSKSYVVVPRAMLEDTDLLRSWILRAMAALPAFKPKRKRS